MVCLFPSLPIALVWSANSIPTYKAHPCVDKCAYNRELRKRLQFKAIIACGVSHAVCYVRPVTLKCVRERSQLLIY